MRTSNREYGILFDNKSILVTVLVILLVIYALTTCTNDFFRLAQPSLTPRFLPVLHCFLPKYEK